MLNIKSRYNYNETVNYIKNHTSYICSIVSSNHRPLFIHCESFSDGGFTFYYLKKGRKTYTVTPTCSFLPDSGYTITENDDKFERITLLRINVSKQLFSVKIRIDSPRGTTKDVEDVYKFLVIKKMGMFRNSE